MCPVLNNKTCSFVKKLNRNDIFQPMVVIEIISLFQEKYRNIQMCTLRMKDNHDQVHEPIRIQGTFMQ